MIVNLVLFHIEQKKDQVMQYVYLNVMINGYYLIIIKIKTKKKQNLYF